MCIFQKVTVTFGKVDPYTLRHVVRRDGLALASERAPYHIESRKQSRYIVQYTEDRQHLGDCTGPWIIYDTKTTTGYEVPPGIVVRGVASEEDAQAICAQMNKPKVTYIATATETQGGFVFKVLASNARNYKPAGKYSTIEEGKRAVEQQYNGVTWVTPYRFQKELTAI